MLNIKTNSDLIIEINKKFGVEPNTRLSGIENIPKHRGLYLNLLTEKGVI